MRDQQRITAIASTLWVALIGACFGVACSSEGPTVGQSGSEGMPSGGGDLAVPCPCGPRDALRVTVLAQQGDTVSLRVEEILRGQLPLVPGDVIEGIRYDDELACHLGCADVAVGEQAFAFYVREIVPPRPPCAERAACIAACETEEPGDGDGAYQDNCACRPAAGVSLSSWDAPTCGVRLDARDCAARCQLETDATCPTRPSPGPKYASVSISRWADPIVFARGERGELSVPLGELGELLSSGVTPAEVKACTERFGQWSDYVGSEYQGSF
jgi:hypothetical protein